MTLFFKKTLFASTMPAGLSGGQLSDHAFEPWGISMLKIAMATAAACLLVTAAAAQDATSLKKYVDANGFLDVQALTCAQLADTYQEDADALTAWYSGWYNGLAKKHYFDYAKGREAEHQVIVYCKAHRDKKIIEAIAVIFKDDRAKLGIEMK